MFKPTTLRVYLLRARELGLNPDDLLKGSGVSWSQIDSLQTFDLDQIAALFDTFARRTTADFAMKCGHACSIRDFGIVGFSMMSMSTLREAFEYWTRYSLLAGHPLVCTLSEEGDHWSMNFVPRRIMSAEALRFCAEVSIAAIEPVIEELTGQPVNTRRIDFAFGKPADLQRYSLFSVDSVRFGTRASAYVGLRSNLDRQIRSCDGDVSMICAMQSDRFLAELTRARSIREQLEDLMLVSVGEMPSLDDMARALRMSRRSLQRELGAENLSYQQLVKEYRQRHAMVLLRENRTNIKSIAYMLGFRDVSSFRRAFRDWTGLSVGDWKQKYLQSRGPAGRSGGLVNLDFSRKEAPLRPMEGQTARQ